MVHISSSISSSQKREPEKDTLYSNDVKKGGSFLDQSSSLSENHETIYAHMLNRALLDGLTQSMHQLERMRQESQKRIKETWGEQ